MDKPATIFKDTYRDPKGRTDSASEEGLRAILACLPDDYSNEDSKGERQSFKDRCS